MLTFQVYDEAVHGTFLNLGTSSDQHWNRCWYHESCITYVKRVINVYNFKEYWQKGFVVDHVKVKVRELQRKHDYLTKRGYKFRKGSVPNVSCGKSYVRRTSNAGLMHEARINEGTHQAFKRTKRAALVKGLIAWDGISHYNNQRGWKRSKKEHQYD